MEHAYLEIARSLAINQSRRSSIPINTANSLIGTLPFSGWANQKQTGDALLCTDCSAFRGTIGVWAAQAGHEPKVLGRHLDLWAIVATWSDLVYSDVP